MYKFELLIILILWVHTGFAQESSFQNDSSYNSISVVEDYPYDLEFVPKVKLPNDLRIDGVHGIAFVVVIVDTNGNFTWHSLRLLSLKNSINECFINYRLMNIESNKTIGMNYYPLPIHPYVMFFKEKLGGVKFKVSIRPTTHCDS